MKEAAARVFIVVFCFVSVFGSSLACVNIIHCRDSLYGFLFAVSDRVDGTLQ